MQADLLKIYPSAKIGEKTLWKMALPVRRGIRHAFAYFPQHRIWISLFSLFPGPLPPPKAECVVTQKASR